MDYKEFLDVIADRRKVETLMKAECFGAMPEKITTDTIMKAIRTTPDIELQQKLETIAHWKSDMSYCKALKALNAGLSMCAVRDISTMPSAEVNKIIERLKKWANIYNAKYKMKNQNLKRAKELSQVEVVKEASITASDASSKDDSTDTSDDDGLDGLDTSNFDTPRVSEPRMVEVLLPKLCEKTSKGGGAGGSRQVASGASGASVGLMASKETMMLLKMLDDYRERSQRDMRTIQRLEVALEGKEAELNYYKKLL